MGAKELFLFTFALGIIVVSQAQYYGRMRGLNSIYKDHCTCTCEDIASLIACARIFEEKEPLPPPPPSPPCNPTPCLSNFEDLIMKLVNALVYTATETTKNSCCCSHSPPIIVPPNNNGNTGGHGNGGGLIDVDILNKNKNGNVLDVDVGNQHVVGVGLGGSPTGQNPTGQNPTGQHPPGQNTNNPHSGGGLINLDLLNPNKPDNVAELDLGKQNVLGVGLGGGGGVPNPNSGSSSNTPNSGEGLINLDLLNPKNENNVADLDLGGKTLLGVGLGN